MSLPSPPISGSGLVEEGGVAAATAAWYDIVIVLELLLLLIHCGGVSCGRDGLGVRDGGQVIVGEVAGDVDGGPGHQVGVVLLRQQVVVPGRLAGLAGLFKYRPRSRRWTSGSCRRGSGDPGRAPKVLECRPLVPVRSAARSSLRRSAR